MSNFFRISNRKKNAGISTRLSKKHCRSTSLPGSNEISTNPQEQSIFSVKYRETKERENKDEREKLVLSHSIWNHWYWDALVIVNENNPTASDETIFKEWRAETGVDEDTIPNGELNLRIKALRLVRRASIENMDVYKSQIMLCNKKTALQASPLNANIQAQPSPSSLASPLAQIWKNIKRTFIEKREVQM